MLKGGPKQEQMPLQMAPQATMYYVLQCTINIQKIFNLKYTQNLKNINLYVLYCMSVHSLNWCFFSHSFFLICHWHPSAVQHFTITFLQLSMNSISSNFPRIYLILKFLFMSCKLWFSCVSYENRVGNLYKYMWAPLMSQGLLEQMYWSNTFK